MSTHIKDGYYVAPFKKIKFKGDTILIPYGDAYGDFLTFEKASQEYLVTLKKHFHQSQEYLQYRVQNNKVISIDADSTLREKLKLPPIEEKIDGGKKITRLKERNRASGSGLNKTKSHQAKTQPNHKVKPKNRIVSQKSRNKSKNEATSDGSKSPKYTPTIVDVARYFSIFPSDVLNLFRTYGIDGLDAHFVLSKSEFDWLKRKITADPIWKSKRIPLPIYIWDGFRDEDGPTTIFKPPVSPNKSIKPPKSDDSSEKHLELRRDVFTKKVKNVSCPGLPTISSYFQDIQARLICSRMSSSYARSIAERHSNPRLGEDLELLAYQLHYLVNKALQVFGGKVLTLIYELPPLRFAQKTALEVYSYSKARPDFPMISFQTNQIQVNVAFFTKLHLRGHKLQSHVILFKHKTYETIGSIDALGRIRLQLSAFRPKLSLFIDRINDKEFKIYSGVQTGVCDICKHPLSDPLSLRIGIGPVCAKNIGLDRSVYDHG